MTDDLDAALTSVGALSDPVRRRLYGYVATQPGAVSREQAADACDLPAHTVKFHLDRLVAQGLLETESRRLSGRTGPGAGRPAKLYRRVPGEISISLPDRSYDLAAELLARAAERSTADGSPVIQALAAEASAYGAGVAAGRASGGDPLDPLDLVAEVLADEGYEPFRSTHAELCLRNCPFDRLARGHTDLVCGMNLALVQGVVGGLEGDDLRAVLQPDPQLCCVRVSAGPPAGTPARRPRRGPAR